jgi:hypothetical protein
VLRWLAAAITGQLAAGTRSDRIGRSLATALYDAALAGLPGD